MQSWISNSFLKIFNKVTDFNYSIVSLAASLALTAYYENYTNQTDGFIHECSDHSKYHPFYIVTKDNNSLWITFRGSHDDDDWDTNFDLAKTTYTSKNITIYFHRGFYLSAVNTLIDVEKYIKDHNGPIYFTGHSSGASIAICATILASIKLPSKDLNCIAFAPVPTASRVPLSINEKIATFLIRDDFVPYLSLRSAYDFLANESQPDNGEKDIKRNLRTISRLMTYSHISYFMQLGQHIVNRIDTLANTIATFKPEKHDILLLSGVIYRISKIKRVYIDDCIKNATTIYENFKFNFGGFIEHDMRTYKAALFLLRFEKPPEKIKDDLNSTVILDGSNSTNIDHNNTFINETKANIDSKQTSQKKKSKKSN